MYPNLGPGTIGSVGFGAAEGVMYAGDYYNGLSGGGIYLVRFISCVALHATWTVAVAVGMYKRRRDFLVLRSWDVLIPLVLVAGVPMVLHGLYDTLLKHDRELWALVTAVLSFAWLIWQIETTRAAEPALRATDELAGVTSS